MATAIEQQQYNNLWLTTGTNPLLSYSAIASQNKSLATNAKQIIKAINEVLANNQGTQATLDSFMNNFNTFVALIGDTYADSTLSPKLDAIGDNVILALDALSTAIKGLGDTIADKADTSTTNEIGEAIIQINKSIDNINSAIKSGAIGSGGGTVAQEIINLGACNVPYSTTSVYQRYALITIPTDVLPKIDFNKPIRLQIFHTCYGGFDALYFDSSKLDFSKLEVGYSTDKTKVGIFNNTGSLFSASKLLLIIE